MGDALAPTTPIDEYLARQRSLTAVERFTEAHERGPVALEMRRWSDLLPATPPAPGEQYAFDVDLDRCTGCKACVTACHSLNGLDGDESWRRVGTLRGIDPATGSGIIQTVTHACHHCIDPACLSGCPVDAYRKDRDTGIVVHLDDQCIGCLYCTLICPYEVPAPHRELGIVRKCDLCAGRLAQGEAPACVQGCPNDAIAVTVVRVADVLATVAADAGAQLVPGAPPSSLTLPTTTYRSARPLPQG
ncbi:4Fe-4S dicluster domain-containing protein, partial [Rhabdothermincola sp.]|uniref:4Fe-4S dicluster domain-containing protein n=1 Tax=Rhabdothermincola sp. TaxID=2820405 RepID=UPI002FE16B0A